MGDPAAGEGLARMARGIQGARKQSVTERQRGNRGQPKGNQNYASPCRLISLLTIYDALADVTGPGRAGGKHDGSRKEAGGEGLPLSQQGPSALQDTFRPSQPPRGRDPRASEAERRGGRHSPVRRRLRDGPRRGRRRAQGKRRGSSPDRSDSTQRCGGETRTGPFRSPTVWRPSHTLSHAPD